MKLFKTILKGIGYTILAWLALIFLLLFSILCMPLVILIIPIGVFSYAYNPESIIKIDQELDSTIDNLENYVKKLEEND